ncbi:B-cell receptor CD22-like [Salmo trutta]|uniref:B-cell receptor CD22-like n=1 Tax=Salmo trutta TaxID=8032 RepID=UPI0011318880|nr:B-cell receptor CD22-like [Salmo trutta]
MDPEDLSSVPGYKGHIEYLGDMKSEGTLRLTDLRVSDSAGYRFRLITSGEKFAGSPVSLIVTVSSEDTGRYSCAVKDHEDLPSPEETLTVRYGPRNTSVSVSPSGEIVEGSSVTLTCSSDANPPVDKYTWYKKNVASPKASGQSYRITNIISEDRGEYYCEASNIEGTKTSIPVHINVMLFPWVPLVVVVGVGAVLTVGALLVTIYYYMKRRSTGGSDATTDTQSVRPDCNSDTYTGLNMKTWSPDYDTLESVHPDPNSDMCTSLKKNTRSPE